MNAKFSVGEEVILQSKAYPEFNGEAVVLEVFCSTGGVDRDGIRFIEGGYAYMLTIKSPTIGRKWHEAALRKKHQPSEFTFNSLMDNLKLPQKV